MTVQSMWDQTQATSVGSFANGTANGTGGSGAPIAYTGTAAKTSISVLVIVAAALQILL